MAMDASRLKAAIKTRIYDGLSAQFGSAAGQGQGYTPIAEAQWNLLAEALSGIATDIITEITTNAEVPAGIPTAIGGPTIGPGTVT